MRPGEGRPSAHRLPYGYARRHVEVCGACGHEAISYNSCRNRHCPKCQGAATAAWLEAQREILLPVPYAHVVFTLPDVLAPLALQNPRLVYGLLSAP